MPTVELNCDKGESFGAIKAIDCSLVIVTSHYFGIILRGTSTAIATLCAALIDGGATMARLAEPSLEIRKVS